MKRDYHFLELCKLRRSIRTFDGRSIPDEDINYIIECARLAPSACNMQPWKVVIIDDCEMIKEIADCSAFGLSKTNIKGNIRFIKNAPVVLALCKKPEIMNKIGSFVGMDYADNDVGIFGEHLALAAASRGIGSCWLGMGSEKKIASILNLPKKLKFICLIALGYPEGGSLEEQLLENRPRKNLDEIVIRNKF